MPTLSKLRVTLLRIAALLFSSASFASAQTWNNTGTGDWFTASNWTPANVPTSSVGVLINNGGTVQISSAGAVTEYVSLSSSTIALQNGGTLATGIFNNINGTVTVTGTGSTYGNGSDSIYIGQGSSLPSGSFNLYSGGAVNSQTTQTYSGSNGNGSILIDGVGSQWTNHQLFDSAGTLTIQNGGTVSISAGALNLKGPTTINGAGSSINSGTIGISAGALILIEHGGAITSGAVSGGIGTFSLQMTVTDTGSNWTSSGQLTLTTGSITVQNGGLFSDASCDFGDTGETNNTTMTVTGAGSQWINGGDLKLGYSTHGVLNIMNGGHVSDATATVFRSMATVDGTNSVWSNTSVFTVEGTLNVQNGGSVTDTTAVIAPQYTGTVTFTGANTTWQNSGDLQVGTDANATLSISNAAAVTDVNGYIGYGGIETSSVTIDGTGSKWTNSSTLYVGYNSSSTGTLTIQGNSVVEVDGGTTGSGNGTASVATQSNANGTLQIGNGTSAGTLVASTVQFGSGIGSLIFDHTTVPYTFSAAIKGAGVITQEGVGTTILSGNSNTFTGATSVTGGALLVLGTLGTSSATVTATGGTIGGSGTISGPVTLNTGGLLSPGGDGGASHLTVKSVTWKGGGGMVFHLGTVPALLTVTGALTKSTSGTYNIDFENAGGIAAGTTYNLISYGSTTFTASDFSYTSSLAGFSGAFSISGNTLKFTVSALSPVVAPAITSAHSATFTLGQAGSFTVTGTGNSAPMFTATDLPSWAALNAKTGVLSGTPPNATGSPFAISITAANGAIPNATQIFTLTVVQPPAITSANNATFTPQQANSFTVVATGTPAPTFSATGLPSWATLNPNTGVLSGNPPDASGSPFTIDITAANGATPNATQVFTLTVQPLEIAPVFTSASATTFAEGELGSFIVTATGSPAPTFSATGLPAWASLNATTGVLSGTPTDATGSPFTINLTASNGNLPNATQVLTLSVQPPQAFTGNPTATPENDGVPNLLKYLFDIDQAAPMSASDYAALPVSGMSTIGNTPYLTLTFRENPTQTGITINVQTSPDLQTWTTLANPTMVQTGNDPNTGDPIMQAQVQATGTTQFIRLDVTSP